MSSMGRMSEESYARMCRTCQGTGVTLVICPTCEKEDALDEECEYCGGTGELH